jgi:hypothetical protein
MPPLALKASPGTAARRRFPEVFQLFPGFLPNFGRVAMLNEFQTQ